MLTGVAIVIVSPAGYDCEIWLNLGKQKDRVAAIATMMGGIIDIRREVLIQHPLLSIGGGVTHNDKTSLAKLDPDRQRIVIFIQMAIRCWRDERHKRLTNGKRLASHRNRFWNPLLLDKRLERLVDTGISGVVRIKNLTDWKRVEGTDQAVQMISIVMGGNQHVDLVNGQLFHVCDHIRRCIASAAVKYHNLVVNLEQHGRSLAYIEKMNRHLA